MKVLEFAGIYCDHIIKLGPKQPSPRKPPVKDTYTQGYNDGWNAAMQYKEERGLK